MGEIDARERFSILAILNSQRTDGWIESTSISRLGSRVNRLIVFVLEAVIYSIMIPFLNGGGFHPHSLYL
jgi:hypothetical protein